MRIPWVLSVWLSLCCFSAAAFSTFVPLTDQDGVQYLFVGQGLLQFAAITGIALLLVLLACVAARRAGAAMAPESTDIVTGRWLAPLATAGVVALGLLPAAPGVGAYAAPLSYVLYDLRWWWLALLLLLTALRLDAALGSPVRRRIEALSAWPHHGRLLLFDAVIFFATMTWAVVTLPHLRFEGLLHGDEPRYIRYCEIWYQGDGLEISHKQLFSKLPLDDSPAVPRNTSHLIRAIGEESHALADDIGNFIRHPLSFRWNRIQHSEGFVTGKHGGIYQIHQPGVSAILFPGYFLDRYLFGLTPGHQEEFPQELVLTNLVMLMVYGGCGVGLFGFLRHALQSEALAAFWSVVAMLTLPTAAFAFQLYPEAPALFIILCVANYAWFTASTSRVGTAVAAGAALGFTAWLHPRFLLLAVVLGAVAVWRSNPAARRAFAAAFTLVVLSVMAFDYRVTGSWSPTAIWDASDTIPFRPEGVPINLLAYVFHPTWGLLPHSLLLIAVAPGLVVLGRRSPAAALFVIALVMALAIPAAGHSLSAAGGTPGRLVMAVVPLLFWPIADCFRRFWHSTVVRTAGTVAIVLSLASALDYNMSHVKARGPMFDVSLSGWKPNLAFPFVRGDVWETSQRNFALLLVYLAVIGTICFAAWWRLRRPVTATAPRRPSLTSALTVLLMLLVGTAATAANGLWTSRNYLIDDASARRDAEFALLARDRCRMCFSSRQRSFDWRSLPNSATGLHVDVQSSGMTGIVRLRIEGDHRADAFGRARVEFGDDVVSKWTAVIDSHEWHHAYRSNGRYTVVVWLQLPDGGVRVDRQIINVGSSLKEGQ